MPMLRKPDVDDKAPTPIDIFVVVFLNGLNVSPLMVGVELETINDPVITALPENGKVPPPPPPIVTGKQIGRAHV